ncbi:MAG TPA: GNAT family N-acetyltransferase [Thermoanaerobaculia bacterium]|nr:GNAT family N-acetyltransferase [Thermoanaerobaculia bacterium]
MPPPTLHTTRLTLRPFTLADAPALHELVSAREIALNTLTIPHPYPPGAAEQWIGKHEAEYRENVNHHFAIDDGQVVGTITLMMKDEGMAEIGYWVGVPFWGKGYVSEAAAEILRYGFEEVGLQRIFAGYFSRNAASGRVMEKIGMQYEGTLRHHVLKWGERLDIVFYGILRDEFIARGTGRKTAG